MSLEHRLQVALGQFRPLFTCRGHGFSFREKPIIFASLPGLYDVSQHFLLSRRAKTLSLAAVFRMTDAQAEEVRSVRWADTNGEPVCPVCGGLDA